MHQDLTSFLRRGRSTLAAAFRRQMLSKPVLLALVFCVSGGSLRAAETGDLAEQAVPDISVLLPMRIPVFGASKFFQEAAEAPSSVTIVTTNEIRKYGYRTLADILRSVRGFHVSYNRSYSFLGTRGFNRGDFNSRVLLLVDGHRVNNNISDSAFIGTESVLEVDLIDRVEIIRGPGSALYGNDAFFGVINVITRRGRDQPGFGGEFSGEVAEFDTYKGRVTYGHQFTNGLDVLLSGSWYESQGAESLFFKEFNTPANNNGIAHNADDDAYQRFFGTVSYSDFTLQGAYSTREKGDPAAPFPPEVFNDARARATEGRSYVNLKYAHNFPEAVDVMAQVYYDRRDFSRDSVLAIVPATVRRQEQVGEWWGAELQLTRRLFDRHTLTLGAEYRDDFRQENRFFDINPPAPGGLPQTGHREIYGVYFQADLALLTNLHFNGGVRYDQYGSFNPTVNPRLALIYNPWRKAAFKAIYGTAFRAPSFFEQLFNPALEPETITTYELVYEQEIGSHLRSSLSGYFNRIDDMISAQSGLFVNRRGADARGLEAELEGFWAGGWQGRISYAYQETEDRLTGERLSDSPRHLAKANLTVPVVQEKVFAGIEFQYTGQRTTLRGNESAGFGVLNFTLFSRNLVEGLELSASVYNLFDRRYSDPAPPFFREDTIPQDGRTFRVKLTYRF